MRAPQLLKLLPVSLLLLEIEAATPPVKVSLRSSWPAPPFLVEVIETIALDNEDAFIPLVDALAKPDLCTLNPETIYRSAITQAVSLGYLEEPLAMVESSLALHAATPKIEAFYQHYKDHHQPSGCGSWVYWYGEVVCDVEKLANLVEIETTDSVNKIRPKILSFDHIYPPPSQTVETPPRTAILYGSFASQNFRSLHSYLFTLSTQPTPKVEYILRHVPPEAQSSSSRSHLSGYGVSLDLKKMDYLALDDRHSNRRSFAEKDSSAAGEETVVDDNILSLINAYPENATAPESTTPLTSVEVLDLGLQAAQLISDSPEPLDTLTQLSQNFPKYATSLARRVVVNQSLKREVELNQYHAQAGINMVWLNGAVVQDRDMNPFALLRLLRKERSIMNSLTSLGLSRGQAVELLTHPVITAAQSDPGVLDGIFDASDRTEGGNVIVWLNDIEKDSPYSEWSPSMHDLLRPLYPGQFHRVRLNLYNVIFTLDLSQASSLEFITGPIHNIINRRFPFRFGMVPNVESENGAKMAKLVYYLVQKYGNEHTIEFMKRVAQFVTPAGSPTAEIDWASIRSEFLALMMAIPDQSDIGSDDQPIEQVDFESILTSPQSSIENSLAYTERLGTSQRLAPNGHAFINGKHFERNDAFLRNLQLEAQRYLQYFLETLHEGGFADDNAESMSNYFYDLPTTIARRNQHIFPAGGVGSLRLHNLPDVFARSGFSISSSSFLYPSELDVYMTLFIVADFDTKAGLDLLAESMLSIHSDSHTRISFIHNPATSSVAVSADGSSTSGLISHLVAGGHLATASPHLVLRAFGLDPSMNTGDNPQATFSRQKALGMLAGGSELNVDAQVYANFIRCSHLVTRELQISPGHMSLIVNGRVIGPLQSGDFVADDFKALDVFEFRKRTAPVLRVLESVLPSFNDYSRTQVAGLVSMSASVISAVQLPDPSEAGLFDAPQTPRNRNYAMLADNYTSFKLGNNETALYQISFLFDPLSEAAQKWSSLISWLSQNTDVYVEVHINPPWYQELPLKRFYRYSLLSALQFDEGQEVATQAVFNGLPTEPIYTLGTDVHASWLVRPRDALYDLDNIQLETLSPEDRIRGVEAVFDLDYLVVEGHVRDVRTNAPPRGVQLQLTKRDSLPIDDTQVVANLGYIQFKAKPGIFRLEIRPGRGRDIFRMESVGNEGWDSPTVEQVGDEITLTNFEGLTLYPRLARLPGMESGDVLADLDENVVDPKGLLQSIISRVKSIFSDRGLDTSANSEQAEINIFTVASGLLYERFASIMILSVLRNTQSTVKFWFIENFLSPSFLEFIPHFAEAYGFKYELVTYKWPSWLRAQKEKQRIIWAYKILFLDVLFPMDLKKVIFVDADQIVRADLKELVDLDLHGAPYGYTPMGDDNTDMEGFRFWKTGYWKEFLQGRPYHISALYVVDLVKFRQSAAGDILRGQYQGLSSDPNSLANLDQDLPNNLQREVPIFSLHEDWLWCETWCSQDRLHRAKTIDLCQNPLTKEPKLSRARKIPEWEHYDGEIARFSRRLAEQGLIRSRISTADVNVLANQGAALGSPLDPDSEEPSESGKEGGSTRDEL